MANEFSPRCIDTLKLLARSKNVLISGSPGTGKTSLLAEVAKAFEDSFGIVSGGGIPHLQPIGGIPIPPTPQVNNIKNIPAPTKTNRKVFRTVFHQNSKYRDFVTGIVPNIKKGRDTSDFVIASGALYKASEHAKAQNGAALLIIDEINRGAAVQIFGGSIVSIEADKRLAPDGSSAMETQYFEILDPATGDFVEYALPNDLYILAAMNQADASVEPLDVAFLRRWEPLKLEPEGSTLRKFYGLADEKLATPLPPDSTGITDVLEASYRAWLNINEQISLGRGQEFQIGHGVLMSNIKISELKNEDILEFLCIGWAKIKAHVEEVFFGDIRGIAATLNAIDAPPYSSFRLIETTFADDLRYKLDGHNNFTTDNIYSALRAIARE